LSPTGEKTSHAGAPALAENAGTRHTSAVVHDKLQRSFNDEDGRIMKTLDPDPANRYGRERPRQGSAIP
jgi:hypothetical protein